jgi:formate hydrogenlyase subunit 6/NADH:ubiquinone oxidoreductase subunit I
MGGVIKMNHPGKIFPEVMSTLWKRPATVNYPKEKASIPKNFRGKIAFNSKLCSGCKMCMRDCPAKALAIEKVGEEKIFKANFLFDQCIYCAQCVDSCPKNALAITPEFELAQYDRKKLQETQE